MSKGFRLLLKDIKSGEFKRYFKLGFDEYINISAEHGSGVSELLKKVTDGYEPGYEDEDVWA